MAAGAKEQAEKMLGRSGAGETVGPGWGLELPEPPRSRGAHAPLSQDSCGHIRRGQLLLTGLSKPGPHLAPPV